MKSHLAAVAAVIGIGLALSGSIAVVRTIWFGVQSAITVVPAPDPSQLAAIIGETIIAVFSRGVLLLVPAIIIYLAFFTFGQRDRSYLSAARLSCVAMMVGVPIGTLAGIILYFMLGRLQRRSDITTAAIADPQPPSQTT
jgi:ABC-type sulfate transport system permease subunit